MSNKKQKSILDFFKATTPIKERVIEEKKPRRRVTKKKKDEIQPGRGLDRFFKITVDMSPEAIERRERIKKQMQEELRKMQEERRKRMLEKRKEKLMDDVTSEEDEEEIEGRMRNITYTEDDEGVEICKNLYLGSAAAAMNIEWLESETINFIINCTPDVLCYYNSKENKYFNKQDYNNVTEKTYLRVQISDSDDVDLKQYFDDCHNFIDNALKNGEKVLVHCLLGRSRSASIVASYIMKKYEMRFNEVLILFDKLDYKVNINNGFQTILYNYERRLFKEDTKKRTRNFISSQVINHEKINAILKELEETE